MDHDGHTNKLSAEADRELTRLWRTWRTVLEMLVDRVCIKLARVPARGNRLADKIHLVRVMRSRKPKRPSHATGSSSSLGRGILVLPSKSSTLVSQ